MLKVDDFKKVNKQVKFDGQLNKKEFGKEKQIFDSN